MVEKRETVLETRGKIVAKPETVAELGTHGMVVYKRETVLDLMAKSLQSLRLSRNSRCVSS